MNLTSSSDLASPFSAGASGAFSSGFTFSTSLDFLGLAGPFYNNRIIDVSCFLNSWECTESAVNAKRKKVRSTQNKHPTFGLALASGFGSSGFCGGKNRECQHWEYM